MLHKLRAMVRSWFAKALLALLVLSFAAWGIGDVFITRAGSVAASVGGEEISVTEFVRAFNIELERRSSGGQRVSVTEALERGLDQIVLGELAERAALDIAAAELGLSAPDSAISERITTRDDFLDDVGRFDPIRYVRTLNANGYSQKEFEAQIREEVARTELIDALFDSIPHPIGPVRMVQEKAQEQRKVTYLKITSADIEAPPEPAEEEIAAYLDEHAEKFENPERRDFSFLWLSPDALADPENVTEEEAREYYDINSDLYGTPEFRTVNQFAFETETAARAALARLEGEESLADIATERGVLVEDISLGRVTQSELPAELAESAFAVEEIGGAGPVETDFGWTVLEILDITEGEQKEFEEVRDEIVLALAREEALDRIPQMAVEIEDLRAGGSTLEEVTEAMDLTLHTHLGLDRSGIDVEGTAALDLPSSSGFLTDAFEIVLDEDTDPVDLSDEGVYLLRVDAITDSTPRSLEDARDEIQEILLAEARKLATLEAAERAEARIQAGETIAEIATSLSLEPVVTEPFLRAQPDPELGSDLVDRLFALEPEDAAAGAAWQPGEAIVLVLDEILPADEEVVREQVDGSRESLSASLGNDAFVIAKRILINEHGFNINQASVQAALGVSSEP